MDPHEAGVRPTRASSVVSGHPDEVAAVGGVQPRVVALRLDVADLGARHEAGDPAELDRRPVSLGVPRPGSSVDDRRTASARRSSRTGLST